MTDPYEIEQPRTTDQLKAAAAALKIRVKDLLVLGNHSEPFQADTDAKVRHAEWFAGLWEQFGYTEGVHIRRIHYRAQSAGDVVLPDGTVYENTEKCHETISRASRWARDLGLVDPSKFADRRNNPTRPHSAQRHGEGEPEPAGHIDLPEDTPWSLPEPSSWKSPWFYGANLDALDLDAPDIDADDLGETSVSGYDYHRADQPFYEALWIEKSTMNDVLEPLCARLGVDFLVNSGFASKTQAIELLRKAARLGKPLRVFTISDFDPAGAHMPIGLSRELEYYRDVFAPLTEVVVRHLGMHREWIERYELPRAPIKEDDRRKANFEARHGDGCVELDALEALHPGTLADEVHAVIGSYRDDDLADRLDDAEREAEGALSDAWRAATPNVHSEIDQVCDEIDGIAGRYRDRLRDVQTRRDNIMRGFGKRLMKLQNQAINALDPLKDEHAEIVDEYQADIEPYAGRLAGLWDEMQRIADETPADTALPERPQPQVDPDEQHALFDSRRHWWDQLQRYREEQGKEPLDHETGYVGESRRRCRQRVGGAVSAVDQQPAPSSWVEHAAAAPPGLSWRDLWDTWDGNPQRLVAASRARLAEQTARLREIEVTHGQ